MCNFFSAIVLRDGSILFTEEDSHETVIARSGLKDNLKHFVRVEYNREDGYEIDERAIPEWYERIAAKAETNIKKTFAKIETFNDECMRIEESSWEDYENIQLIVHPNYNKIEDTAWEDYYTIHQTAMAAYISQLEEIEGYVKEN